MNYKIFYVGIHYTGYWPVLREFLNLFLSLNICVYISIFKFRLLFMSL